MHLLDTNILSPLLQPTPPVDLVDHVNSIRKQDLYTSSINRGELLYGLLRLRKGTRYFLRYERLWDRIQVLSFDSHCADLYGRLRAELERKGTPVPELDLMIACVVLGNELVLVTADERHFLRIPGLKLENWLRKN